ncbi:restriction endonuclease subunit S, partial [Limimaricola sp. ASW11-118]
TLMNGYPYKSDGFNLIGDGRPVVRIRDLLGEGLPTSYSGIDGQQFVVKNGDLVIGMDGDFNCVFWKKGEALLNQRVAALKQKKKSKTISRFAFYQIPIALKVINDLTPASTVKHLASSDISALRLPCPDLDVQKAIADFLDRETARIDALVEKKRRFSELILEREEASFLRAVTGKDEDGSFSPSGCDWIGDLPEGWLAPKFLHVARLESGHTPSRKVPEYWVPEECNKPWVSLADVWQLRSGEIVYLRDTQEKVSDLGLASSSARMLPRGTVVLSRTASVGFAGILDCPMATTQDFVGWIPSRRVRSKFLYYVLRAMKPEFRRLMIGSTHKTIYMPDIRSFRTPLPPLAKQDEIVSKLDASIQTYRKVHSKLMTSVQRLTELRASLITAAVTGQIDPATYRRNGTTDQALDRIAEEMGQ